MGSSYYKMQLTDQEQTAYDEIIASLRKFEGKVTLQPLSADVVSCIVAAILLDRPELFFLGNHWSTCLYSHKTELELSINYSFREANSLLRQLSQKGNDIVASTAHMPPLQKALALHDYLVKNLTYSNAVNGRNEAHTIVGALQIGKCVCEGYAKAYKFLCDKAGIPCVVVRGEAMNENGTKEGHAWNIIQLGNTCFHVDVTFDHLIDSRYCSRAHMLLSTREILTGHTFDPKFSLPNCPQNQLPMVHVRDMDGFEAAVRQDHRKNLSFSEYALSSYVDPKAFVDAFMKRLTVCDVMLHNRIRGFFYSNYPKVNVIGVKWR